ncbi:MAG: nucleoside-diphosphate kinase [Bdellovibrionales bacterium]|nr:nucleoside-diphosphate kinase [Bdellovibrionales bacterium]
MEKTFVLIKPNVIKKKKAGAIISRFQEEGLEIIALKMIHLTKDKCEEFYKEHKERPFFKELVEFIISSPVVVMALKGEKAVLKVRQIMGDTDPKKAQKGTLRFEYGDSVGENAIHGSDSLKSAERELALFFLESELFE